jgi:putative MATE family efflux protein
MITMKEKQIKDMTVGNPTKIIIFFAIPLLIGNIFQQFYNMADTLIVGRCIGVQALAAVGAVGSIVFAYLGFVNGVTSGFAIPIAQSFGAKKFDDLRRNLAMGIELSVVITVLFTLLGIITLHSVLALMKTPEDIYQQAYSYMVIIIAGLCSMVTYNFVSAILRALGNSKVPLYFLIVASIVNVVLDIVLIRNFGMGVEGAAVATVIAQGLAGVLSVLYLIKSFPELHLRRNDWRPNGRMILRLLQIGIPMGLQFSVTAIGIMVLQSAINGFGSETVAAYTAASKVEQLATQILVSIGATVANYVGQNLGAGRYDRIKTGVRKAEIIGVVAAIFGGVLMILCGKPLIGLFVEGGGQNMIDIGYYYLRFIAFWFTPLALLFIHRNSLQGMGETFVPLMAGVAELVMRAVCAFGLVGPLGFLGVCIANPASWVGAAIPLIWTYYHKRKQFPVMNQKD